MKKALSADAKKVLSLMFEVGRIVRQACLTAEALPLPLSHLETLRFVACAKAPTMRDVAKYLRITAPSATAIVEALSIHGYIVRSVDAKDRRVVRLSLSAKGKRFLKATFSARVNALRGVIGSLSAADTRELLRILSMLVKNK